MKAKVQKLLTRELMKVYGGVSVSNNADDCKVQKCLVKEKIELFSSDTTKQNKNVTDTLKIQPEKSKIKKDTIHTSNHCIVMGHVCSTGADR